MIRGRHGLLALGVWLALCSAGHAQEEEKKSEHGWKAEVTGSLSLTQASFSNWAQGGDNSVAWQTSLKPIFTRSEERFSWENKGKFLYGSSRVADLGTRKSADEIRFGTMYTRKLGIHLDPFFSATILTQFTPGYTYANDVKTQVSDFLDPGYFTQSAGVGYNRSDIIKTRLGATVKETVTSDFPIPYADNPDTPEIEKTRIEAGITSTTEVKHRLADNLLLTSELILFSNLKGFNKIDLDWSSQVTAKVAKYVNVTLSVDLLYDHDIIDDLQIKEVLALGLTYSIY